jgi:hypothetical protein
MDRSGMDRMFLLALALVAVSMLPGCYESNVCGEPETCNLFDDDCDGIVDEGFVDEDGVYDPRCVNDRLLLGLKGSLSEFELSLLSQRAGEARKQKAARGELQFRMPVGLQWTPQGQIELDPDLRVQQAMRLVFRKFTELGTVMAVLRWFVTQQLPVPSCKRKKHQVLQQHWEIPHYSTLMCIYKNPLYAGAYAYGKSRARTRIVEHRALKSRGHRKPLSEWSVLLLSHHPGYISWSEYLRNQQMLKEHTHQDKAVDRKAGRGGNAGEDSCSRRAHGCAAGAVGPARGCHDRDRGQADRPGRGAVSRWAAEASRTHAGPHVHGVGAQGASCTGAAHA